MTPTELGAIVREFTAKAVTAAVAPLLERNAALELRLLELETHPQPVAVGPAGPAGPQGLRGEHGETGERGADGINGRDGAAGERGPQGEKGLDGLMGRDGQPGRDGMPGPQGEKGLDGTHGINGRDGADGLHGKDGADGLGFDDFDLVLDEQRGWILRLSQGARVKEWVLGIPFDAKVWAAGKAYPVGAGVTWDGHYWIAQAATSERPGDGCRDWRLAVRRGKTGGSGPQGKQGERGLDYTQLGEDGRKW